MKYAPQVDIENVVENIDILAWWDWLDCYSSNLQESFVLHLN